MDIDDIFKLGKIIAFLKKHHNKILDEHILGIYDFMERLNDSMHSGYSTTRKFGTHYNYCLWSKEECSSGPDTCECVAIDMEYRHQIVKLMDLYERMLQKNE